MTDLLLAGDIGGTKAHLLVLPLGGDPRRPLATVRIPSQGHPSLAAILRAGLAQMGIPAVRHACLGIPGAVIDGRVSPTNLPWTADERGLAAELGLDGAYFLNDLAITAHGLPLLGAEARVVLHAGVARDGALGVIAPGTGMGMAVLHGHQAMASEGGHAGFAPRTMRQVELVRWLLAQGAETSLEAVASGRGLPTLWRFLGEVEGLRDAAAVDAARDLTPQIVAAAADPRANPRSVATVRECCLLLAQEAGDLAIRALSYGGVALAGGMPPRLLPWLREPAVAAAFLANPRMAAVLQQIPLWVATDDGAAALGAAVAGSHRFLGR